MKPIYYCNRCKHLSSQLFINNWESMGLKLLDLNCLCKDIHTTTRVKVLKIKFK